MTTIPLIKEKPTRFGSPSDVSEAVVWEPLGDNVFECRVLLCPEDTGGYSAVALRLPGVVSQGESIDEALQNINEAFAAAVAVYLEDVGRVPWSEVPEERPKGCLERWILVDV